MLAVLPATGPKSRNTVVSCTNDTPSGTMLPDWNSSVPKFCSWKSSEASWKRGVRVALAQVHVAAQTTPAVSNG